MLICWCLIGSRVMLLLLNVMVLLVLGVLRFVIRCSVVVLL